MQRNGSPDMTPPEDLPSPPPDPDEAVVISPLTDEPHYAEPTPSPVQLKHLQGLEVGVPPSYLVIDGTVRLDERPGDWYATIFADYDDLVFDRLRKRLGNAAVDALQCYPVSRTGPYRNVTNEKLRRVGKKELMVRHKTLNVQRYVWTGAGYEQSYPLSGPPPSSGPGGEPP